MESLRESPIAAVDGQTMGKEEVPLQGPNEETSLLSLPDDDLLSVLEYLNTPDLLSCRAVCHRLRDVALRPELWRRRSFNFGRRRPRSFDFGQRDLSSRSLQAAVLRVAPCASSLSMWFTGNSDAPGTLAATTRCAAVKLILEVDDHPARLAAAKLVIRNQAALGMLRTLEVRSGVFTRNDGHDAFADVLAEAFSTQGLTRLVVEVTWRVKWPKRAEPAPRIPASIKEVELTDVDPCFVHRVLRSHAATLRVVSLSGDCQGVAPLLAAIPGLQRLECPVMEDLPLVAKCASLRSLKLTVSRCKGSTDEAASQATAAAFLRAATHLEELELNNESYAPSSVPVELLTGLASWGRAALRKLCFSCRAELGDRLEMELASALPGLPALEFLVMPRTVSRRVLAAINPGRMPRLRGLSIPEFYQMTETWCAHAAMHEPDVCRILASYAHFFLVVGNSLCEGEQRCEHCAKGCHGVPWPSQVYEVGFYTHEAPGKEAVDGLSMWYPCETWMKV
ncbi:uncharacterized protein LOC117653187 isoform X2 [Thrips palmi]|nr:uncharacterized protein LOC117653187 isoform X2 [Thrips palmi]XP_034254561.1 uncharacterized protein LOC117653187 isoform X2 [Thrips palmi]XP_034254562.1 uncharacterized protein LOC117653187 isoform X2 [Thrips palmi]XP_034254563.1 uncharacterized protein LOC117653187 isoform X2 [Thrips palmi]XP_034254564.1 uncharacterized protein LOC117653187 isoform X2 [Thrips palmi]XP_034254565.1 uncharacterized protein LOC117653187 isoform X2 [Thrips palmi]XP_034254567.1 uncharacterized protein LOC11765